MPPAIEVVRQAERVPRSQVPFNSKVHLLRIGIHEILCLRISEWLEAHRQKRRRIQIILVEEDRAGRRRDAATRVPSRAGKSLLVRIVIQQTQNSRDRKSTRLNSS